MLCIVELYDRRHNEVRFVAIRGELSTDAEGPDGGTATPHVFEAVEPSASPYFFRVPTTLASAA
jgi:hypothetical protein